MKPRGPSQSLAQEEQLLAYYVSEVGKKIASLTAALQVVQKHASLMEMMTQIIGALQAIKDLAMIHGYEGVEAVAERMEKGARHYLSQDFDAVGLFVGRMKQALDVLLRLTEMTDEREAQRLVQETEHVMDYAIDSLSISQQNIMTDNEAAASSLSDRAEAPVQKDEDRVVRLTEQEPSLNSAAVSEYFDICEPEIARTTLGGDGEYEHTRMVETAVDDVLLGYQDEEPIQTAQGDSLATRVANNFSHRDDKPPTLEPADAIVLNSEATSEFEEEEDEYVLPPRLPIFMRLKRLFGMA